MDVNLSDARFCQPTFETTFPAHDICLRLHAQREARVSVRRDTEWHGRHRHGSRISRFESLSGLARRRPLRQRGHGNRKCIPRCPTCRPATAWSAI